MDLCIPMQDFAATLPRGREPLTCCSPKPALADRPLLDVEKAAETASIFEVLANPTRLRILQEIVRSEEASPSALAQKLEMKPQAISNQIQRLADRRMLRARRNGSNVYYRVVDSCIVDLLERALCMQEDCLKRGHNGGSR